MDLVFIPREDHSDPTSAALGVLDLEVLPFASRRIYWITNFVQGASRGNHAHKSLRQAMLMLTGSLDLLTFQGKSKSQIRFSSKDGYLLVPPGSWREMKNASHDAVLLVIADNKYIEEDYIRNWDDYIEWCASAKNEN